MARRIFEQHFRNSTQCNLIYSLCLHANPWHKIILACIILISAPLIIFVSRHSVSLPPQTSDTDWGKQGILFPLSGTLDYVQDTQLVWQAPSSPKAVLFIAHGCHGSATHFWDKSHNCAECIGLPEERVIVMNALSRDYAVIAISSTRECWNLATDKDKVLSTLSHWIKERGYSELPVLALGASSGGYFISALAKAYKFNAIVIMISEGFFQIMEVDEHYPSTLFVHMVKDKRRASLIKDAMEALRTKGVNASEVKCYPLAVTPHYFTKIPGLDALTSEKAHQALKDAGVLDKDNYMMADGRSMNWMVPLRWRHVLPEDHYNLWDMHMRELLNLAFGYHEMTSIPSKKIFDWLDRHLYISKAVDMADSDRTNPP
ncbi:hypothetical protein KP509_36G034100 [Ceratopteris richardii]|nr:hypothetical protein KP509_36G034100 [Ceratopteris richardii]